mgnify:CR=1 FL=1
MPRLMFACWIVVMAAAAAAETRTNSPLYHAPRLAEITIDGDAADWADRGLTVDLLTGVTGLVKRPADLDASFRLGWDPRGLLVLVRVRDDRFIENPNVDRLWHDDAIELYLATGRGEADQYQAVIAPGMTEAQPTLRTKVYNHAKAAALKQRQPGVTAARKKTDGGYVMEVLMPWEHLAIDPVSGREVGFQIYVDDRDAVGGRQFHAAWYPRLGTFANTGAMHRVALADERADHVRAAGHVSMLAERGVGATAIGPAELAGKTAGLQGGGEAVGRAKLRPHRGRALAATDIGWPLPGDGDAPLRVFIDGQPAAVVAGAITPPPAPESNQAMFGARIQRTMSRLAYSSRARRQPVTVLFYGQSIVESDWWRAVAAELEQRYPEADLTIHNRALGGWEAHVLVRAAEADVYPLYPDLVIFHVYAGEHSGQVERIIADIRRRTTADILVFPHHAPLNDHFETGAQKWRLLAQKYNCELADVRDLIEQYLQDQGLEEKDVLRDSVHPNDLGNQLIAAGVMRHLRLNNTAPGGWANRVRSYEVQRLADDGTPETLAFTGEPWRAIPARQGGRMNALAVGESADSALRLSFEGNRIDAIVGPFEGPTGTAKVLIDGKPPTEHPGIYAITRVDPVPGSAWPALRRVSHAAPLVAETWTLRITEINDAHTEVRFEVEGSVTGPDGSGKAGERFVSDSGRVVIEADDYVFAAARRHVGGRAKVGDQITWQVVAMGVDSYEPAKALAAARAKAKAAGHRGLGGFIAQVTLAQGLANGRHTLTLIPNGDGPVPLQTLEAHRPPLK